MKIQVEVLDNNVAAKIQTPELYGEIFFFKRENVNALAQLNIIKKIPMCYILYSDYYDRNINKSEVYIGQTDTGMVRIKSHHKEKPDWNKGLLIFYGKPSYDVIFKLESDLIQLAKVSLKYHVSNIKNENRGHVCDCQEEKYDSFLQKTQNVLSAINVDIFERNADSAFIYESQPNLKALLTKSSPPYEIKVLAGSFAEKYRLGHTKLLFEKYEINTEVREKLTTHVRRGVKKVYKEKVEYFYFNVDMFLTIEEDEEMALFRFLNVNGLRMKRFFK